MATYKTPIVAGVFDNETKARDAFEMLRNAKFGQDQVGVALPGASSVKNGLASEFIDLGVPTEQARFYEKEFNAGHIVVSVRPDGREEEAKNILNSNGAYDYPEHTNIQGGGFQQAEAPMQDRNMQGQPTNQAATDNYGQEDYRKDQP
jgi:hypothetical protein